MASDPKEMNLDDSLYYPSSHCSAFNHSIDDLSNNLHSSAIELENFDGLNMDDSNDSSYTEDDSQAVCMIKTEIQSQHSPTINKPTKHPGLVLKAPVTYQGSIDRTVIPFQKEGIAICERCGAVSMKQLFYSRKRRFCSITCARGYSGLIPELLPLSTLSTQTTADLQYTEHQFKLKGGDDYEGFIYDQPLPQIPIPEDLETNDNNDSLILEINSEQTNTYNWDLQIKEPFFYTASVTCFPTAPLSDIWDNILVGMKVEIENTDCGNSLEAVPVSFWMASVIKIVGYKALLRYEGFEQNTTKDFWITLCSNKVYPIGWCASMGNSLNPPRTIENKYNDWKDFLRKRLIGARSLPWSYCNKITSSLKSRFKCGLNLEVIDKNKISQVKLAIVHKIIGKRLNVKYYDMTDEDTGFWCHEDSPLLHPVGWAKRVGHNILAPINYLEKINEGGYDEDDATDVLFNSIQVGTNEKCTEFCIGMKLEAIDPLKLNSICAATVMDVLHCGYIMIRIDTYELDATGADWFCYHKNSPCIFPVGFCQINNILLTPPKSYDQSTFSWENYLKNTNDVPIPRSFINSYVPHHGFVESMKIEAADLMDPRLVCVATITKVAGRLLKIHFDGWPEDYDQWLDCYSPDIYPVGWCCSVGHKLEGPLVATKQEQKMPVQPKIIKKRGRKKLIKDNSPKSNATKVVETEDPLLITNNIKIAIEAEKKIIEESSPKSNATKVVETENPLLITNNIKIAIEAEKKIIKDNPPKSNATKIVEKEDPLLITNNIKIASEVDLKKDFQKPETVSIPAGLEQSMTEAIPPVERNETLSATSRSTNRNIKFIPRLVDKSGGSCDYSNLCPNDWNVIDVAQFLSINNCSNYCELFTEREVDGKMLLSINKEDVLEYTGGKVGPSLKIYDLVQQLKVKINSPQSRQKKANKK